jgi:hypothetical protein
MGQKRGPNPYKMNIFFKWEDLEISFSIAITDPPKGGYSHTQVKIGTKIQVIIIFFAKIKYFMMRMGHVALFIIIQNCQKMY